MEVIKWRKLRSKERTASQFVKATFLGWCYLFLIPSKFPKILYSAHINRGEVNGR